MHSQSSSNLIIRLGKCEFVVDHVIQCIVNLSVISSSNYTEYIFITCTYMSFISKLDWRFATKKFDATKSISDIHLSTILSAIKKAPTSYGLQPFHVEVVTDAVVKEKIKLASYNQSQVVDAPVVLVFCVRTDAVQRIDSMIDLMAPTEELKNKFEGYKAMMHSSIDSRTSEDVFAWASKQAYIALGFALAACAELEIDSCPMEGFVNTEVDKILELPEYLKSVAFLAIGYRGEEPTYPKFRFPESDLFTRV